MNTESCMNTKCILQLWALQTETSSKLEKNETILPRKSSEHTSDVRVSLIDKTFTYKFMYVCRGS